MPIAEHLAHSGSCAWALSCSVSRQDGEEEEARDPMSDEMAGARKSTYELGEGWCHEAKKGWKCKVKKVW